MEIKSKNIPKDWDKKKMKELVKLSSGEFLPKNKQLSGKIPVYGGNGITGFHNKSMMEDPTIIVGRVGAHCGSVHLSKTRSWITDNAIFFKKISGQLELEYIFRYLSNININLFADISAQPKINQSILNNITIFFPKNKLEQQKIVSALSNIDKLLEQFTNLISKKKNIKQGAMQELLTGKRRLEGFSGEWETKPLSECGKITMGQSPESKYYNKSGDGLPLIQGNADIENRKTIVRVFTSEFPKIGKVDDIIMTVRAPVGNIAKTTFDCCLGRGVCSISSKNNYLYHYLIFIENNWKSTSTGSTFDSINYDGLSKIAIKIPNSNEEQLRISKILSDMDSEIEQLETQKEKYINLKQAMMQKLLTGEIRLV